jgi:hypothetical protein
MGAGARVERRVNGSDRAVFNRPDAARPGGNGIEADVGGDPIQPCSQRGAPVEPIEATPRPHHRVLDGIFGIGGGPEHAIAVASEGGAVRLELSGIDGIDGHEVPDTMPRHRGQRPPRRAQSRRRRAVQ